MAVKQSQVETRPEQINAESKAIYLEYEWWARLQLQHARGAQGFKHRVWVVAESLVYHQDRVHIIHDKANLIRTTARLREAFVRSCHRGRQTHHHSVVDNRAVLENRQVNSDERSDKGREKNKRKKNNS